jgi:glutamyl-Q tRNA(Asp) synthetase
MEDIDPPREVAGAASAILHALERFDLRWDRDVLYQSTRTDAYRSAAETLLHTGLAFRCSCTRAQLRSRRSGKAPTERYPGICRTKKAHQRSTAIRVLTSATPISVGDTLQGERSYALERTTGDYVIFRRDGLPAYHLAVVVDDAEQGVTHVIRGVDLLDSTATHIHLQQTLGLPTPDYGHLPVIINSAGQKLSKRTGARPLDLEESGVVAFDLLRRFGLRPPIELRGEQPEALWRWAISNWDIQALAGRSELPEPSENVAEQTRID